MQLRAQHTQEKILDAAIVEFSEKGFHGARVDAIASAAGVNKQRIYAYYTDKDTLFAAVLRECFNTISREEEALMELYEDDLPSLPKRLLTMYMQFHANVPHFWRLLAWENLEGARHLPVQPEGRVAAFFHLRALYQQGQARGLFKAQVSFETFIFLIFSLTSFYHANQQTMSATLGLPLADSTVREHMLTELLEVVTKGIQP